jgi:deoxyribose-phosphate aldolase
MKQARFFNGVVVVDERRPAVRELDMSTATYLDYAKMIDHSILQPTMTDADLEAGCELARNYQVASVCIKPYYVARCAEILKGSGVFTSTVIGFPHGGHVTAIKVAEALQAMKDGAVELDMVVNIGKVLSKDWKYVAQDIKAVVDVAHANKAIVKVIFENCFLQDEHKIELCKICGDVNADFVKTSTGYGATGAVDDDLRLMRKYSPAHVRVKAAGGVRTFERLPVVRDIGVSRVGTTSTQAILDGAKEALGQ